MKHTRFIQATNDLDDDLISETYRKMNELDAQSPKSRPARSRRWLAWGAVAASLLFVLMGSLLLWHGQNKNPSQPPTPPHTMIAIDVNPSMELELDEHETVIAARALNREAETVLRGISLNGVQLIAAMDTLVDALVRYEYLTVEKTAILISVDHEDAIYAEQLQENLSQQVTERLNDKQMEASVITQTYDKNETASPEGSEMSSAKAALVRRIQESNLPGTEGMTYEQLADMSIDELNALIAAHPYLMVDKFSRLKRRFPHLVSPREVLDFVLKDAAVALPNASDIEIKLNFMWNYLIIYTVTFDSDGTIFRYEIKWEERDPTCFLLSKCSVPVEEHSEEWAAPTVYMDGDKALAIVLRDIGPLPVQNGVNSYSHMVHFTTWKRERAVYTIEVIQNEYTWSYVVDAESGEIIDKNVQVP